MDNSKFPDELIKEMLSPPLLVPDALFADTGPVSPFAKATSSASDVLIVCKRWMRVGTPALYETVIIRSTAQAQALEMALTRNPEFGRFVKKLRLEGVYGEYITPKIIATMTRVTDFCFTVSIYSADKLAGLTKALDTFEPKRIILTLNNQKRRNAQNRALIKKLTAHVKGSQKLEYFSFPRLGNHGMYNEFTDERDLASALVDCSALHTVEAQPRLYSNDRSVTRNAVVALLQKKSDRKVILNTWSPNSRFDNGRLAYEAMFIKDLPAGLAPRVVLRDSKGSSVAAASVPDNSSTAAVSNPFFIPMPNASTEVRTKIWSEIFSYAGESQTSAPTLPMLHWLHPRGMIWFDHNRFDRQTARNLLLVSHEFYQALIPVLFRHLRITNASTFGTCKGLLDSFNTASLGQLVETLDISYADNSFDSRSDVDTPSYLPQRTPLDLADFLSQLTNVRAAHFNSMRPGVYSDLSSFGSSLRTLSIRGFAYGCCYAPSWTAPISLDVFAECNALQELEFDQEHVKFAVGSDADVFPSLEVLKVHRVHGSFFTSLTKAGLPNLKRFEIRVGFKKAEAFIKQHGKTLTTLATTIGFDQSTLNSMPSLQTLDLYDEVQPTAFSNLKHAKLERLSLHWDTRRGKWLDRYKITASILSTKHLPALKEVVVGQKREIWPSTERDIKKSPWPQMAVTLAEKNITLLDHTGRSWRPRLQLQQE